MHDEASAAPLRDAIIAGVAKGQRERIFVALAPAGLAGQSAFGRIVAADQRQVTVNVQGMEASIPWSRLSPKSFYVAARKYSQDHRLLAAYCRAHGLQTEAAREAGLAGPAKDSSRN